MDGHGRTQPVEDGREHQPTGCASCFLQYGSQVGELTFAGKPVEAVTAFAIVGKRR